MEPFNAFGAAVQKQHDLQSLLNWQQDQEKVKIAQENMYLAKKEAARKAEYQANNDLLTGLWKAVTDKGTPPEVAEHLRDFADEYRGTMSKQQAQMLDITTVRGLYSEEDRKQDKFKRIYGGRPNADLSNVPKEELIPKLAELKVAQTEYDYKHRNFMSEGTGTAKEKGPALVPVTSFLDSDNKPHNIFARKDPKTGMVSTVDTGSDLEGDMFIKAVAGGMSPSTMAYNDFIPFPDSKEKIVSTGGKKYSMRVGQSLTDGSLKTLKIELGDDDSGGGGKGLQVPANIINTLDMMNSAASGDIAEDKYGKYGDIIRSFKELEDINLKGPDASKSKEFMTALLQKEIAVSRNYRGWVIAPVYTKKPSGWFGYYQNDGRYYAFPADTRTQITVNGKTSTLWYKEKIQGQEGSHFWHDAFGNYQPELHNVAPGSVINNKNLKEVDASEVVKSRQVSSEKNSQAQAPVKTISFGEWLIRSAHKHEKERRAGVVTRKKERTATGPVTVGQGMQKGMDQIMDNNFLGMLSKLPIQLAEKLMQIQVPVEDE